MSRGIAASSSGSTPLLIFCKLRESLHEEGILSIDEPPRKVCLTLAGVSSTALANKLSTLIISPLNPHDKPLYNIPVSPTIHILLRASRDAGFLLMTPLLSRRAPFSNYHRPF